MRTCQRCCLGDCPCLRERTKGGDLALAAQGKKRPRDSANEGKSSTCDSTSPLANKNTVARRAASDYSMGYDAGLEVAASLLTSGALRKDVTLAELAAHIRLMQTDK